ncbi:hypothetical protein MTQ01_15830 [Streptomyces sp. XM4193]|uniref:hypothetical protein n=1 Tax=Streptomyces sp. XM4193 TaxID=2929782 RepID=UPI001FF93F6C|nr:hypothetical protein [Streptomyces sp. XM4193]MCK1797466.1 hypothetical protein [Streptomyces sp. XM4193]
MTDHVSPVGGPSGTSRNDPVSGTARTSRTDRPSPDRESTARDDHRGVVICPLCSDVAVVGEVVRDLARERVGRVMGREGPYVQLRPLGGGREWDAEPRELRPMSRTEVLSALVAELNRQSRRGI